MKKLCVTVYIFALALLVFAMSGCGGSSGGSVSTNNNSTQSAQSRRMTFTSTALKRNGTYKLFRGTNVGTTLATPARYYLAPGERGTESITMNLEFDSAVSRDLPFVITESDKETVIFAYNPSASGTDITSTGVLRYGGSQEQLSYSNLTISGAIDVEDDDAIDIVLNSDGTATAGGETVPSYDYVWHADPQHPAEYWTLGTGGTEELDSDAYEDAIEAAGTVNGLYIAHDIRYTPNTLNFTTSQTAKKDEDTEYVVYYDATSSAVAAAIKALGETYGTAYSTDKYIFATLPMSNGMGGGGTPPDGNGGGMSGDRPGTPPDGGNGGPGNDTRMPVISRAADSDIAAMSTMTHSASDAYSNPVLHITEPGTYRISGTWKGQIWVEAGAKAKHQVALILNGVDVECTVAPALVFYKVYKWAEDNGYDDQSTLTANNLWRTLSNYMLSDDGYYDVGAIVEIADGTTNTFTGANNYRLLELSPKLDDDTELPKYSASEIGSNISAQQKMYKLDGAFHSRRTMVIGGGTNGTGKLNITSTTCEGLDSEMHMLIEGGNITVSAPDDGINVNEDNVSVFTMNSGTLTVSSTQADGIDSNGWIVVNGGTLNITAGNQAQNSAGEAGIDAENDVYISSNATYNWTASSGNGGTTPNNGGSDSNNSGGNGNTDNNNNSGNSGNNGTDTGGNSGTGTDTGGNSGTATNTYNTIITVTKTEIPVGDSTFTLFPESFATDTEGARNIPESGSSFQLVHRVNDFAGIK